MGLSTIDKSDPISANPSNRGWVEKSHRFQVAAKQLEIDEMSRKHICRLTHSVLRPALVRPSVCWISREGFDLESPNFVRTSTPTYSTAKPDMMSQGAFGRQLSEFEKTAENATSDGVWSNFSGSACCLAQPNGGRLVLSSSASI